MFTIEDFKEQTKTVEAAYYTLLSIAGNESKLTAKEETIHHFNALYYAMQEASNALKLGLEGKFPWEKNENE